MEAGEVLEDSDHEQEMNFRFELRRHHTNIGSDLGGSLGQIHRK